MAIAAQAKGITNMVPNRRLIMSRLIARREYSEVMCDKCVTHCWHFIGHNNPDGYGMMRIGAKVYYTHRIAALLWFDMPLDSEEFVRHRCVNRKNCFNPKHLILGTQAENNKDTIDSGRFRNTVLSDSDVRKLIFAVRKGGRVAKWATLKGVAYSTVLKAYRGITHREIAEKYHSICDAKGFVVDSPISAPVAAFPATAFCAPEDDKEYLAINSSIEEAAPF